jgi:RNA polymerase sigma-70 factor (ECF subfamily)
MLELPDLSAGPALLAESAEFQGFIEQCVAELPANYREAVILRGVEGLSNEEAAAVLEVNLRNFKSRLHRGRMAIRRRVEE